MADRVRTLKETEKGVNYMCSEMEQLYNEGIELGKKQGIAVGEQQGKAASEANYYH